MFGKNKIKLQEKKIKILEKKVSELEGQVQVLTKLEFTQEEVERLKSWAKRVR